MSKRFILQSIVGVTFVILIGFWAYSKIEEQIKLSVKESLNNSLSITEQALLSLFQENKHTVTALAASQDVIFLTKKLLNIENTKEKLINSHAQQQLRDLIKPLLIAHHFRGFFVISPNNISLASTRNINTGVINPLVQQPKLLDKVWRGLPAVSLPQISDVPLKNTQGELVHNYATMYSAAPIKDENNNIIAILALRMNPFDHFTQVLQRGRVGETGETYAFNNKGVLISNSRFDEQLIRKKLIPPNSKSILNVSIRIPDPIFYYEKGGNLPLTLMAKSALAGNSGYNGDGYYDYRGIKVVGSWIWNEELEIGLATEQDFDEAYLPLYTSRNVFILFCFTILLVFILWLVGSNRNRLALIKEIQFRKKAELESKKLSVAIDQNPNAILITNILGKIEYVNNAFTKTTGYSYDEVIGQNPNFLQSGKETVEKYQQLWARISQGKNWQGTLINKKKDGTIYTDNTMIFPVIDRNNSVVYFVAIEDDITEKVKLETMLRHSQKMDAVGQLAGGIAHDFNNLLGIILGNVSMIKRKTQLDEKNTKRLEAIEKSANRGVTLTKQILSFTRKEAHVIKTVNINDIVKAMDVLIEQAVGAGVKTKIKFTQDLWLIDLDPSELEDAIINLCVNAGYAMEGSGEIVIATSNTQYDFIDEKNNTKHETDCVVLSVSDNGCGIPPEIKNKIFDPFFTTKPRGKGTGLGLSKVFGFVKRSGGELNIYSEVGIGTEFKLFFPKSINSSISAVDTPIIEKEKIKGSETILLVDDEQELATVAESYLNEAGFKTYIAYSGEDALVLLEKHSHEIALVLSDVVMPGKVNGYALANEVLKSWPNVRMSLMSGFISNVEINITQKNHASRHLSRSLLQKPYSESALLQHVRNILDEKLYLEWKEEFTTGIKEIDDDHKTLVFLLNRIYSDRLVEAPTDEFLHVIEDLNSYSQYHFKREEAAMKACDFPQLEKHAQIHLELISQLEGFIEQVRIGVSAEKKNEILKSVHRWLFDHLETMDSKIYQYSAGNIESIKLALNKLDNCVEP